jgi:hypothetical protein
MYRTLLVITFLFFSFISTNLEGQEKNYTLYHSKIAEAEKLIASENYVEALQIYDAVLNAYDFVFVRDTKIATQLAIYLGKEELAFEFLRRGASAGWEINKIRKNAFLKKMVELPQWKVFEKEYPELHAGYESRINPELRSRVRKMFSKDQKKALGALFRIGSNSQDKYAEKKFAPQSEQHLRELIKILSEYGYPGEKLVGNDYWASTILSHHNSISQAYARKDTIYPFLKPQLTKALERGEVSPFELALIDEWHKSTLAQGPYIGYGILNPPSQSNLKNTNELRTGILLRTVETRNALIDIQDKTQMNFYMPGDGWIDGKIEVIEN